MNKYYIENEKGEWLTPVDELGEAWTRDPLKAWTMEDVEGCNIWDSNHIKMMLISTLIYDEGVKNLVKEYKFTEISYGPRLAMRDQRGDIWINIEGRQFKKLVSNIQWLNTSSKTSTANG